MRSEKSIRRVDRETRLKDGKKGQTNFSTSRAIALSHGEWLEVLLSGGHQMAFHNVRAAAIPILNPNAPQFCEAGARLLESIPAHAKRFSP
jgi:hypothetical protein